MIPGRTSPTIPPLSVFTAPASSSKSLTQTFVSLEKLCVATAGSWARDEDGAGVLCAEIAAIAHKDRNASTRKCVFICVRLIDQILPDSLYGFFFNALKFCETVIAAEDR